MPFFGNGCISCAIDSSTTVGDGGGGALAVATSEGGRYENACGALVSIAKDNEDITNTHSTTSTSTTEQEGAR